MSCRCVEKFIADCPNEDDAKTVARRHEMLNKGHTAVVEKVLATPLEGLL